MRQLNNLEAYNAVRSLMKPGDVIAFSGRGFVSNAIKLLTNSPISHVGVVFETFDEAGERRVQIAESTTLNNVKGVQMNFLSERLLDYPGEAWWLPLSEKSRSALDVVAMHDFLLNEKGEPYDYKAIAAFLTRPIPGLGLLLHSGAVHAWFCDEIIIAGFEIGNLLHGVEPDHCNPRWLTSCKIYSRCEQLIGKPSTIPHFNSL